MATSTIAGLTGGICCGKSTVAETFIRHSIPVIDADIVARQVVEPGTIGLRTIIEAFGKQILQTDGTLDRSRLGQLVFFDPGAMHTLNQIMAPLIQQESARQLAEVSQEGNAIIVYDAALICEMGNADKYRPLIVVSCTQEQQLDRLMKRNGLTVQAAMARIAAQMPTEEKVKMANYVIDTSGTKEESIRQTESIIQQLHNINQQEKST